MAFLRITFNHTANLALIKKLWPKWPKIAEISKRLSSAYIPCLIAPSFYLFHFQFVYKSDLLGLRTNETVLNQMFSTYPYNTILQNMKANSA